MLRLHLSAGLTGLILASVALAAPSPAPAPAPPPATLDALSAADLERAISLIKERYIDPAALNATELNRALLAGLIDRLGHGVALLPANRPAPSASTPFYREVLDGHIGYLRPGELSRPQLQELDGALRSFAGKKVDALILDLRAGTATNDYPVAAEFANRFIGKGLPLFSLRGPDAAPGREFLSTEDPGYAGLLVVLVDRETSGAPEVLAGVLRHYQKGIVMGEATAGRAVEFADLPLPGGAILRVAAAAATLPEQAGRFPGPVEPDVPVTMPLAEKRQIFQQSLTKGLASFVFQTDRPHLNEAALVAGTNPEIEAAQAAQQRRARGEAEKPALHDPVLQRAVDLATSVGVFEKHAGRSP